ncbi:MAG: M50 family metallopeptidase [Bacilli bacterium]
MQGLISTVLFLLSLGVLILIHELGHFLVAKAFNVYVKEFSIGFGPVLVSWTKGETKYALKAFPLGGYVAMVGEEVTQGDDKIPFERSLLGISKPKRALVMSAGIILNLVLAFVLFFASNWGFTQRTLTNQMVVTNASIANVAGINEGDVLVFTNLNNGSIPVTTEQGEASHFLYLNDFQTYEDSLSTLLKIGRIEAGGFIAYEVDSLNDFVRFDLPVRTYSDGQNFTERSVTITLPAISTENGFALAELGVTFRVISTDYTFTEALVESGRDWWRGVTLIVDTVVNLFRGQNLDQVGGIVAIFSTTSSILNNLGLGSYIFIWGLISVNLAVFNLLPFPGLDGWHLLVITIEGIFKKEIPSQWKNVISLIGFFILMGLMVFLLVKDILALALVI